MKKNKKERGFTLIELLATILVLSIIAGLVATSVLGVLENAKAKTYQTTVSNIEKMAAVYLKENSGEIAFVGTGEKQYQCIKVRHLIDSGYFDNEILKSKVSAEENVNPEWYVYVSRDSETKVVEQAVLLHDNPGLMEPCKQSSGDLDENITFDYPRGWARSKEVTITYTLSNVTEQNQMEDYKYLYTINGGNKLEDDFEKKIVTEKVTITAPSSIEAKITKDGEDKYSKTINISKIDSAAPVIGELPGDTKYEQTKNVIVTIEESAASGMSGFDPADKDLIVKYGWSTSKDVEPDTYKEGILTYTNCTNNTECQTAQFQAYGSDMTGEYYLWVEPTMADIAGNVVEDAVSTGTYKFDNEKPIVNISRKDYNTIDNSKSTDNVGITNYYISTTNEEPGVTADWTTETTYDTTGENTYYVWAKDEAGNISDVKSINSYKVTRTEGVGTTLKISSGEEFKGTTYALEGSPIYITGTLKEGYKNLKITYNGETITSGTTKTVSENTEIVSAADILTYTINYYIGNASSTAGATKIEKSTTCTYGESCTIEKWATFGKTFPNTNNGWSFAGWNTSKTGTSITYTDGATFTYTNDGDIDLYAIGARTFKFYSGIAPKVADYSETQYWNPYEMTQLTSIEIKAPKNTIDAWSFVGYRATNDASSTATFKTIGKSTPKADNLTSFEFRSIYSMSATVYYNANGGTGETGKTTTTRYYNSGYAKGGKNEGANYSTPTVTLAQNGFTSSSDGYEFESWLEGSTSGKAYSEGATYTFTSEANSVTMYANWKAKSYTINFYLGNGTSVVGNEHLGEMTCEYNKADGCILTSWDELKGTFRNASNGWKFYGWTTDQQSTVREYTDNQKFTYNKTNNINLFAIGYRTFNFYSGINAGTADYSQTQYWNPYKTELLSSIEIRAPKNVIDTWSFVGYRAKNDASSTATFKTTGVTVTPAADYLTSFEYRAIYSRTLTINYDANAGTGETGKTTATQYYNSGYNNSGANITDGSFTIASNNFTRSGYEFSSWADGSVTGNTYVEKATYTWTPEVDETTITKTMYALWTANAATITITKDGNAYTELTVALYQNNVSKYTSPTANNGVYTFSGVTNGTYNIYVDGKNTSKTVTVNSTGVGTVKYYTLTVNAGSNISKVSGGDIYLSGQSASISATPKTGYTFSGWTYSGNVPTNTAVANTTVTIDKITTLTAAASDIDNPDTPTITISDCDTFTYSSSDKVGVTGYYVSTSDTTPKASDSGWTTSTTKSFTVGSTASTYYIWAKDAAGNISETPGTIKLVQVARSQGANTTLTTRYNSTSSSTGTAFTSNIYVLPGSSCKVWSKAEADTGYDVTLMHNSSAVDNPSSVSITAATTIASIANNVDNPTTPSITVTDCDTFTYSSKDSNGIAGYYVSTSSTVPSSGTASSDFALNKWTKATSTGNIAIPAIATTYYVWAQDEAGNISEEAGTISLVKVSRSQGSHTTLTTRYNSTSSSTGTPFTTSTIYLLPCAENKCNVYVSATNNSGYYGTKLQINDNDYSDISKSITGETKIVSTDALANKITLKIKKDGSDWTNSGKKIELYKDGKSKYSKSTDSSGSYIFSPVEAGTYDIYDGGSDTGLDITVKTEISLDINYYTLALTKGTGISSVSGDGIYLSVTNASISATPSTCYTFSSWTKSSGSNPVSTTSASTTVTIKSKTSLTANATANDLVITFNPNGGSVSTTSKTVKYNGTYGDLPIPTRKKYTFNGWYTSSSSGTKVSANDTVGACGGQTLYAQWTENTIDLSVTISGDPVVGNRLTAKATSDISGATYTYQWYRKTEDGQIEKIAGATSSTYTLEDADFKKYIYAEATATADNYTTATAESNILGPVKTRYTYYADFYPNGATLTYSDGEEMTDNNDGEYIRMSCTTDSTIAESGKCEITTPTIERDGYSVIGWKDAAIDTIIAHNSEVILNANKVFQAITEIIDNSPPTIEFNPDGNATYAKSHSTKVTVIDTSEITEIKYIWSSTNDISKVMPNVTVTAGENKVEKTVTKSDGTGIYYLCVYASDGTYSTISCSNAFYFDNTPPVINTSDFCIQKGESVNLSEHVQVEDITEVKISATSLDTSKLGTQTVTYTATDSSGNKTSKDIEVTVYRQLNAEIVTLKTDTGDGLYEESGTGRYIFRGSNPNNYIKFNGSSDWRILSIEADGTYKIIYTGTDILKKYHSSTSGVGSFANTTMKTYLNGTYYNDILESDRNAIVSHKFAEGELNYDNCTTAVNLTGIKTAEKSSFVTIMIGLPTLTDFFQASLVSDCVNSSTTLSVLDDACMKSNWMFLGEDVRSVAQWTMINRWDNRIWHIESKKRYNNNDNILLTYGGTLYAATSEGVTNPVAYLSPATTFTGSGTSSDPYVINTACSSKSDYSCELSPNINDGTIETLTIKTYNENGVVDSTYVDYSFDGIKYDSTNQIDVDSAGIYVAYIKDGNGLTNSCAIDIDSRLEYRKRVCPDENINFPTGEKFYHRVTYYYQTNECDPYGKQEAIDDKSTWFRVCSVSTVGTECSWEGYTVPCYLASEWTRPAECTLNGGFEDSSWSAWGTEVFKEKYDTQVQSRTAYFVD